jgi:hypothetical protein
MRPFQTPFADADPSVPFEDRKSASEECVVERLIFPGGPGPQEHGSVRHDPFDEGYQHGQDEDYGGRGLRSDVPRHVVAHHQSAVAMAKDALSKSAHPEIKTLAQQIIDAQQEEIETMNNWKAAWSKT